MVLLPICRVTDEPHAEPKAPKRRGSRSLASYSGRCTSQMAALTASCGRMLSGAGKYSSFETVYGTVAGSCAACGQF